ncbi:hypothetical protein MUK42_06934 [Musa troglodytarum]|uniref:Uncharacterized protein n=1 Tax=Musa troglodytarum TaxID=320322 RepID=A0A9E7K1V9_9LILI|nr:hypothetical protein MUK42_06934 [Musa troglodytarum]
MAKVMEALHHLTALAGPHHGRRAGCMAALWLPSDDHRVDDLVGGVSHREHLEAFQVRRLHHRVQEGPSSVGASRHQEGTGGHVARKVVHHADLVVVADPHQRRQENHVVAPQRVGHGEDVLGVERHASRHARVALYQATSPGVGRRVQIVVVELRLLHVARGQHDGA